MPSVKFTRLYTVAVVCLAFPLGLGAFTLEAYKWKASATVIYFWFQPGEYNAAFNAAMKKWNTVNPPMQLQSGAFVKNLNATGTMCSTESNAAGFGYSACGSKWGDKTLAVTLVDFVGEKAVHGSVIFNSNIKFALYQGPLRPNEMDFNRVALHELGHFLGLGHEASVAAIMQPTISNLDILKPDDINGVRARYSSP